MDEEDRLRQGEEESNPKNNTAIGDVILHRTHLLFRLRLPELTEKLIDNWAPLYQHPSEIEHRV